MSRNYKKQGKTEHDTTKPDFKSENHKQAPVKQAQNVDTEDSKNRSKIKEQIVVVNPDQRKDIWDKVSTFSNIIMAIGTIVAVFISAKSLKSSNESLRLTQNSLTEAQKQFTSTHQPFLQATNFKLTSLDKNKAPILDFVLENVSEIPIKTISYTTIALIDNIQPPIETIKKMFEQDIYDEQYIIKESPFKYKSVFSYEIFKKTIPELINGTNSIYYARKIKYLNLVTGLPRTYLFYVKLQTVKESDMFPNGTYRETIYNENFD